MTDPPLRITESVSIPRSELSFRASRAGGPGGQHVNTSSTRVELVWDVLDSPSLTEQQRKRVLDKLANRINSEGQLLLAEGGSRSQLQNRQRVTERFVELLAEALQVPKVRRKTKPPRSAREERLKAKKRRSEIKRLRGPVDSE
ncbi:MAG TPA: alternative ribosome rescue aminoacyl-tRNA hydrolase ArfB [Longimicrobiaceae bacterium]